MSKKKDINLLEELDSLESSLVFECPNCGKLTQDDVLFLCNKCSSADLIVKEGVYMCPSCLEPGENFECFSCESKEVKLLDSNS